MPYPSVEVLQANPVLAIMTGHTCGEACWHARESVCHCSCGGVNHGILNRGGARPDRVCKIGGNLYELVGIISGRYYGEYRDKLHSAMQEVINDRFPGLDSYGYGDWRIEKLSPILDRQVSASQLKWAEVQAVPGAIRLIWARPKGTRYLVTDPVNKWGQVYNDQIPA